MKVRPFTLFSDFNCPFCYALHERLHELHLIERCAWRGVQHAPHLPRPMKPWSGSLGAELRHEVSVVRRLAPGLPLEVPLGKPNTANAIAYAAETLERNHEAGMVLIRRLYQAFWVDGRDISDPTVVATLGESTFSQESEARGKDIAKTWAKEWEATGQNGVPLVVAPSDDLLIGCVPPAEIEKFFLITRDGL